MSQWVRLCAKDQLADPEARGFDPLKEGHDSLFLVKKDGEIRAYRDICPHYGSTTLPWRKDQYLSGDGSIIICSGHGARFDLRSGECVSGPCKGQSLTSLPLRFEADGVISVQI